MKPKTVMLLAVAVGCGLVAMLGVQQAINAKPKAAQLETIRVLVALENIDAGYPLTAEMVEFREMPKAGVPEDAVTSVEQYEERSLNFPVAAEDVIRTSKLSEPGVAGRSLQIPQGYRVTGISVDDTQTQTGMLRPGDLVDVFVTYEMRQGRGPAMTQVKTLLEAITVFATDNQTANQGTSSQESRTKVVSLLVTPEQASYLALAQRKGRLTLVWRNPLDDEILEYGGVNEALLDELRGTVGPGTEFPPFFDINDPELQGLPQVVQDESASEEQPSPPAVTEADADAPTKVGSFLDEQEVSPIVAGNTPVSIEPSAPAAAPEPPPAWTVTIFSGTNRMESAFEIPVESIDDGTTTTEAPLHAGQAGASEEVMTSLSEEDLELEPIESSENDTEQELDMGQIQEVLQGLLPTL